MLREAPMPFEPEYEIVTPPTDEELADLIDKMIDRLQTLGWQRRNYGGPEGPNCSLGALFHVQGASYSRRHIAAVLAAAMGVGKIARWNDMPWRTKGQVIRKLRRTARRLRKYAAQ